MREGSSSALSTDGESSALNLPIIIAVVVVAAGVICCFLLFAKRRRSPKGSLEKPEESWDAPAAFTKRDVGKLITIQGGTVTVDGANRPVRWSARRVVDAAGDESKIKKFVCWHTNVANQEITSVDASVGGQVGLADGSYFENPAAPAEIGLERLDAALSPHAHGWPIRLIKDEFFIQLWQQGGGVVHRNEVPEDQFFDGRLDDPLLHIVAISCPSYKHGGGDPSELNAFHLSIIGPLLAARASQHPSFKVAVFLDKSCLEPRVASLYSEGLQRAPSIFAHPKTEVWFLSQAPPWAEVDALARGWLTLHHGVACTMMKQRNKCVDLALLQVPAEAVRDWHQEVLDVCVLPYSPPPTSERFTELLAMNAFTDPLDPPLAISLYEKCLTEALQDLTVLHCRGFGWGDLEAFRLAELLPTCDNLRVLDLSDNPAITDNGVAALVAALPPKLCDLNLKAKGRKLTKGDDHPRNRAAVMRLRQKYLGVEGARMRLGLSMRDEPPKQLTSGAVLHPDQTSRDASRSSSRRPSHDTMALPSPQVRPRGRVDPLAPANIEDTVSGDEAIGEDDVMIAANLSLASEAIQKGGRRVADPHARG